MGNPAAAIQNGMARIQNAGSAASGGFTGGGNLAPALSNLMSKFGGKPRPSASNVPPQVAPTGVNPSEGAGFISPMIGEGVSPTGFGGTSTPMSAPMAMAPGAMGQFGNPSFGAPTTPPGFTGRGNAVRRPGMPARRPVKY